MASCSAIRAFSWSARDWVLVIFSSTAATWVLTYFSVAHPVTAKAAASAAPTIQALGLTAIIFILSNQGPQRLRLLIPDARLCGRERGVSMAGCRPQLALVEQG